MTNETASAGIAITDKLREGFSNELSQGQELWGQALAWLTDKGLAFAVSIVAAAVILVLGWFAIKLIVSMVGKAVEKGGKTHTLFGNFIRNVTGKICWAILIVVVLGKLGVDVRPIVAGLGVTGFILGFAFQESLGNLASGLMIAINEPFKIGDYVVVAGLTALLNGGKTCHAAREGVGKVGDLGLDKLFVSHLLDGSRYGDLLLMTVCDNHSLFDFLFVLFQIDLNLGLVAY